MILILVDNAHNRRCAEELRQLYVASGREAPVIEKLVNKDLSALKGDTLTLLDLSGDGEFQKYCAGKPFASRLLKNGLPTCVKKIEVIISDVLINRPVASFASALALSLNQESHGRIQVIVKLYSNANYWINLIEPPSATSENWRIHGLYPLGKPVPQDLVISNDSLLPLTKGTKPLWEGKNIRDALKKTIYPDTGCGYSLADIADTAASARNSTDAIQSAFIPVQEEKALPATNITASLAQLTISSPGSNKKRNSDSLAPEKPLDDEKMLELSKEDSPKRPRIYSLQTNITNNLSDASADEKTEVLNDYSLRRPDRP